MDTNVKSDHRSGINPTTAERTSEREFVVTRTFKAPARILFEAWTKPELLMRWWAPKAYGIAFVSVTPLRNSPWPSSAGTSK